MSEATSAVDEAIPEAPPEDTQLAFDVHAFPGGVRGALEAVLMVVDEPLSAVALASALEVPVPDVEAGARRHGGGVCRAVPRVLAAPGRGRLALLQPCRLCPCRRTIPCSTDNRHGSPRRRSDARGHRLPPAGVPVPRVGRAGVNVDGVIRTLLSRGLIEEVGHDTESTAILYGTTSHFLERMGLSSLDELPALAPYLPDVDVLDEIIERAGHDPGAPRRGGGGSGRPTGGAAAVAQQRGSGQSRGAGRPSPEKGGSGTTKPSQPTKGPSMAAQTLRRRP